MKFSPNLIGLCLIFVLYSSVNSAIINIPADYATIQEGINAAVEGDTILVDDGTYPETVNPGEMNLTIMSVNGKDFAMITGGVVINGGQDSTMVLEGFTLNSSGLYVENSVPVIRGCNFTNSENGAYCNYSSPTFYNCDFVDNWSIADGAGVCSRYSSPIFYNCSFINNISTKYGSGRGAAIDAMYGAPEVYECLFVANQASLCIIALYSSEGEQAKIINCTLYGNTVYYSSTLLCFSDNTIIENCIMANNSLVEFEADNDSIDVKFDSASIASPYITCCDAYRSAEVFPLQLDTNNNFSANPMFCNPDSLDFQLNSFSICLPQYNSCGEQIGVFGFGCQGMCGDINGDGAVNILDVTEFIYEIYIVPSPPLPQGLADVNGDASVNVLDIAYLINYLYKDGPAPSCPE